MPATSQRLGDPSDLPASKHYVVFLPAPSNAEIRAGRVGERKCPHPEYQWKVYDPPCPNLQDSDDVTSEPNQQIGTSSHTDFEVVNPNIATTLKEENKHDLTMGWIVPPSTLDAVGNRISELYKNVIFGEDDEEDGTIFNYRLDDLTTAEFDSRYTDNQETQGVGSLISWPPSEPKRRLSRSRNNSRSILSRNMSHFETQDTQSYDQSSTSSITAFPTFTINLNAVTSLTSLSSARITVSRKINLLVVVVEVDGPETIRIKKGADAGKDVGLLKLIVSDGDEDSSFCKITAWRETADIWGGVAPGISLQGINSDDNDAISRGDVVFIENILAQAPNESQTLKGDTAVVPSFTASPNLQSRHTICYRTLPIVASDHRYRPDLRLAASDPGVKRVASMAKWFSVVAGIDDA